MLKKLLICYDSQLSEYMKQRFNEDFIKADKVILIAVVAYFLIVSFLTSWQNGYFLLGFLGGGLVLGVCIAAYKTMAGTVACRVIMATALTAMMAITIQQANGLGEGHFLFFINFTILIRYRDVVPLITLIATTVVHHLTLTYCQSIGAELWGAPLTVFSWGPETSLGLLAPLIYHVGIALFGAAIAAFYILDGNVRFVEATQVIGLVEKAAKGDLSDRIESTEKTMLTTTVNGFFDRLNDTLRNTASTADALSKQAESTTNLAEHSAKEVQVQQTQIQQISSSVNDMTEATREISTNAGNTASALDSAVTISDEGREMATKFEATINELSGRVNQATEVLEKLEQGSQQINSIVSTIRGISEQTNLLALNAAIEAARAGEQGRGFAVVADEVRVLSQRTHDSTEEISSMIGTLQSASNSAVETMRGCHDLATASVQDASNASNSFVHIADSIHSINAMANQIATAAEAQKAVTDEISRNTENIENTTKQFLNDASISLEQASSLSKMSDELRSQIHQFVLSKK